MRGRYRVVELVGQGGAGAVYRAEDLRLPGRVTAVKEIRPEPGSSAEQRSQAQDQFRREASTLARLDHPGLPKVSDYFVREDVDFLVMDFVEGPDLRQLVEEARARGEFLPEARVLDWASQLVEVVRYLAGPIRRVRAITETYGRSMPVEDAAILFVETERGIRGHIELSWAIAKKSPAWVTVYGTKGVLEVGWQQSRYKRDEDNDWTVFGTGYDKVDSFRRNIADFIAGIDGTALMRTTLDDALASVRVIEAAYASAESGGWVDVAADRHLTAIDGSKEKRA